VTKTAVGAWCEYHNEWLEAFRPRMQPDGSVRPRYFGAVLSYNSLLDDPYGTLKVLDEGLSAATFKKSTICNPSCIRKKSKSWKKQFSNSSLWVNLIKQHTSTTYSVAKKNQQQVARELKTDFGKTILAISRGTRLRTNRAFLNRRSIKLDE